MFLSSLADTVPAALLNNLEHNHIVHEQVMLLTVETAGRPHVPQRPAADSSSSCGSASSRITARVGYQDAPDVPAILRLARARGARVIDLDQTSYYVNHVTLIPPASAHGGLAHRLFTLLYRNSTPAARYFNLPPDRVFEVGAYVAV